MKTIVVGITLTVLAVLGSLWALIIWTFGEASCSNLNPFGLVITVVIGLLVWAFLLQLIDVFSDWSASRGVSKNVQAGTKELAQAFRAQAAAVSATTAGQRLVPKPQEQEPSLRFNPEELGLEGITFPVE